MGLVSRHIQFQLYQQIELNGHGQVINAPIDLQLSEWDIVQPDLVIVLAANSIITPSKIKGIPDLVIEILSPTNRNHDLELKRQLYEQAHVPEYWIVDADEQFVLQHMLRDDGTFSPPNSHSSSIRFERSLVAADVDLTSVWAQ